MFVIASVAKQSRASWSGAGLLRYARNDGLGQTNVIPLQGWQEAEYFHVHVLNFWPF